MSLGTFESPFESAQVVLHDATWRLFFHKNPSVEDGITKLTLFWGQIQEEDRGIWYLTAIRELWEKDEAGIALTPDNLKKVCSDGPIQFQKGWFISQVYAALLSKWSADMIQNAQVFSWYDDFLTHWRYHIWGTEFLHIKGLVDKALELWK